MNTDISTDSGNTPVVGKPSKVSTPYAVWTLIGILLVALVVSFYFFYRHNAQLVVTNRELKQENLTLTQQNTELTQTNETLTTNIAKLNCKGLWQSGTCLAQQIVLLAQPSSGYAPLSVTFSIRAPNSNLKIDFGDGTYAWISEGSKQTQGNECVPAADGLCAFELMHKYSLQSLHAPTFSVRLMDGASVVQSNTVTLKTQ